MELCLTSLFAVGMVEIYNDLVHRDMCSALIDPCAPKYGGILP